MHVEQRIAVAMLHYHMCASLGRPFFHLQLATAFEVLLTVFTYGSGICSIHHSFSREFRKSSNTCSHTIEHEERRKAKGSRKGELIKTQLKVRGIRYIVHLLFRIMCIKVFFPDNKTISHVAFCCVYWLRKVLVVHLAG